MTVVPPPDVSCVRVRLIYSGSLVNDMGNRFYTSFTATRPDAAACAAFAASVAGEWVSHLAPLCATYNALTEVDVEDITDSTGAFGTWSGTHDGTRSGTAPPIQTALNVEFAIKNRYRGGKPRAYFPFGVDADLADPSHWSSGLTSAAGTDVPAFFSAVNGDGWSGAGTLKHIILHQYHGFLNLANSSGRVRAVPQYITPNSISHEVTGYNPKTVVGSQRRRRTSTTP